MKRIKKIMVAIVMFSMMLQLGTTSNLAAENSTNIIDYLSIINLYDSSEEIVAYFYQLNPTGYIIVKADDNEMIEYSFDDNRYISSPNEHYYYGGPLTYYKLAETEEGNVAVDLKTNMQINISEIPSLTKSIDTEVSQTLDNFFITPRANKVGSLAHNTKAYTYMPLKGCGATASGILLKYYDDYVSGSYIPSSLESTNGQLVIDAIYARMTDPETGSSYAELKGALNIYLKQNYKAHQVTTVTYNWGSTIISKINADRPCILGLTSHPTYGEHWVVVTGYNLNSSNSGTYTINDGWGNTGININSSYTDGCIHIGA